MNFKSLTISRNESMHGEEVTFGFFLLSAVLFCNSCQQVVYTDKIIYMTVQSTGFWLSEQPIYFGAMGSRVDPVRFLSDIQRKMRIEPVLPPTLDVQMDFMEWVFFNVFIKV